jgi:hypothetical protein
VLGELGQGAGHLAGAGVRLVERVHRDERPPVSVLCGVGVEGVEQVAAGGLVGGAADELPIASA